MLETYPYASSTHDDLENTMGITRGKVGATREWIRNETVVQHSPSNTARTLHLSLIGVGFSDAGQYSCRAQLSGGETEGPVNAGYLRVVGRCVYNSCSCFAHDSYSKKFGLSESK